MKNLNIHVPDDLKERLEMTSLLMTAEEELYHSQAKVVRASLKRTLASAETLKARLKGIPRAVLAKAKAKIASVGGGE